MRPILLSLLLLTVTGIAGCGWQLQPQVNLAANIAPVYLAFEDPHSDFARALTSRLRAAKVELATTAATARLVVTVSNEEVGHHVSAVSALNEPQQYDVFYEVTYRLAGGEQQTERPTEDKVDPGSQEPITSRISRTMNYDKTVALAMQRQELAVQQRLAEELANQVISRLAFWP